MSKCEEREIKTLDTNLSTNFITVLCFALLAGDGRVRRPSSSSPPHPKAIEKSGAGLAPAEHSDLGIIVIACVLTNNFRRASKISRHLF